MAFESRQWAEGELVTAEDLNRLEQGLQATSELAESTAATVGKIKLANQSAGEGAPTGDAPEGWVYTDLSTGDIYRMEA